MSEITNLEFQKKNKNRVNIYVDDVFFAGASLETVMKCGLKKGQQISKEELENFLLENELQKAVSSTIDLVSRFVKTEKEVKDYLKKKQYHESTISKTVEKLKEYGFINDKQYVESYISFKKNVSGPNKIKAELFKKGISKSLLSLVDEFFEEEDESACLAVAKKYMTNKEPSYENSAKLNRYLLSKGFDYADVSKVVRQMIKEGKDEDWDWFNFNKPIWKEKC